jgi:hypothetical protein
MPEVGTPSLMFNRNTFRLRISTLFSYAIERKWSQDNPVEEVARTTSRSKTSPRNPVHNYVAGFDWRRKLGSLAVRPHARICDES